ncbi:MAG: hypothetical protein R3B07_28340 [Polyangiaceae bacterium]
MTSNSSPPPNTRVEPYALLGIALISASLLAYQVLLTRVCALRLHFHFGFLVISNCLLGIGASGSILSLTEQRWGRNPRAWIYKLNLAYLASLVFTWAFLLTYSVPDTLNFTGVGEALRFATFNLVAAAPFFVGGAAVGLLLSSNAARVNRVYAADLLGAGVGCVVVPSLLWNFGAGGTFLVVIVLGLLSLAVVAPAAQRKRAIGVAGVLSVVCIGLMPKLDGWLPVPGKAYLDLTDTVRANFARANQYSRWSANSRIDVLPLPVQWRFMFCRGAAALYMPLPQQKFILQDGDAGTIISDFSGDPRGLDVLKRTLYSATFKLKEGTEPRVFIIGMGGGNDVWAAKIHGAKKIKAVELNAGVIEVHKKVVPEYSKGILEDPNITILQDEGRTALMREPEKYDVVQMTGIDTWTSLTSGAYVLAENYLYTVEAFGQMYDHLEEGGVLQITRMAAEMETLRLVNNLSAALEQRGKTDISHSVMALATPDQLTAVLLKKGEFSEKEVQALDDFAKAHAMKRVYLPGRKYGNPVEQFLASDHKQAFVDAFPRDITPTTDDKPYFFNFTRWGKPFGSAEFIREPTKVSQGNPIFILSQFAFSSVLAGAFIVAPLLIFRRRRKAGSGDEGPGAFSKLGPLAFFTSIGIGFIAIEVSLMQKLTLLLGPPLYSIVVTLFSILIFTGLGSMLSEGWIQRGAPRPWLVPLGIALYIGLWLLLGAKLVDSFIGSGTAVRMIVAGIAVAPIAFALGIPFSYGISKVRKTHPALVPWAWAVNGSATVVGSIGTVILSMNLGFNAVLVSAVVVYALGFWALARWEQRLAAQPAAT